MSEQDDPELEYSPLCGNVTREGITVRVQIVRIAGDDNNKWSLEVVDHENASTVWTDTFVNDTDAYAEFFRVLEIEGIRSFLETSPPSQKLH